MQRTKYYNFGKRSVFCVPIYPAWLDKSIRCHDYEMEDR